MQQPERVFPLDHPLAGCEAKLARAHQNFELLDEELRRYLQGHGDAISHVGQLDPETQRHVRWRVGPVVEPDLILAALIGDFIHDLRSLQAIWHMLMNNHPFAPTPASGGATRRLAA